MSRSLIQTVNSSEQSVTAGSTIGLGTTVRRYGCNCRQIGDAIELEGSGYYKITATVVAEPDAIGNVTVSAYFNGLQIQGATATGSVSTVGNRTTMTIVGTIRMGCNCEGASNLTFELDEGDSTISLISVRVDKA